MELMHYRITRRVVKFLSVSEESYQIPSRFFLPGHPGHTADFAVCLFGRGSCDPSWVLHSVKSG